MGRTTRSGGKSWFSRISLRKPWLKIEVKRPPISSRAASSESSPILIHESFLKGSMPIR
ncbi:hypothetical protein D3C86_2065810 [compost metagenome]